LYAARFGEQNTKGHAEYEVRTRGARFVERRRGLDAEGNPLKVLKPRSGSRMKQGG
jgi:hypothetical protein